MGCNRPAPQESEAAQNRRKIITAVQRRRIIVVTPGRIVRGKEKQVVSETRNVSGHFAAGVVIGLVQEIAYIDFPEIIALAVCGLCALWSKISANSAMELRAAGLSYDL